MFVKRTLLSDLDVVTRLYYGRVTILFGKFYKSVAVSKYCSLKGSIDGKFDPRFFVLLQTDKYQCIVDSSKEEFLKARQYVRPTEGQTIHLKSKNGMYIVKTIINDGRMIITCKKWQIELERGQRKYDTQTIPISDFKCLAGGGHNLVY